MAEEVQRYELTILEGRLKRLEDENERQREASRKRWDWVTYGFLIVGSLSAYTALLVAVVHKAAEGG